MARNSFMPLEIMPFLQFILLSEVFKDIFIENTIGQES
jgi:hypothetical protein